MRSALVAMLLALVFASTGLAGAPDGDRDHRGHASRLSDAELEAVVGGGSEACSQDDPGQCAIAPRVGPITRVILWDERAGGRGRRVADLPDLGPRRIGGSARLGPTGRR